MKRVCYICEKEIKKRPLIFDNYYFCNNNNEECKAIYIFGKKMEMEKMDEKKELRELNNEIEVLRRKMSPLCDRRSEINDKKDVLERQKMIGKCFKYINAGGRYNGNWNVYYKIVGIGDYYLKSIEVELPKNDISIDLSEKQTMSFFEDYCEEITQKVFSNQLSKAIGRIEEREKL